MNWPDPASGFGPLGDGRNASVHDRPATEQELCELVKQRVGEGLALYPQGGKTALELGGPPARLGAALDLTGLSRVIDYPVADMTITVEAGITVAGLRAILAEQGQRFPLDVARPAEATLGGVYATNHAGPRRFGWGRPRDLIIGIGYVNAAGETIKGGGRVVKNVAGYDLPKLLTGSMGTLGIITQMTLKVRPRPQSIALALCPIENAQDAATVLEQLNLSGTRPVAIELLNQSGARLAGLGEVATAAWLLALGYEDHPDAITWQGARIAEELHPREVSLLLDEAAERAWDQLIDWPETASQRGSVAILANLRRSAVARFADLFDPSAWWIQAHAGNGIVRAVRVAEPAASRDEVSRELATARAQAVQGQGNLIVTLCPTDWKPNLKIWGEPRPDWELARRIKAALDPGHVLNPGRFLENL